MKKAELEQHRERYQGLMWEAKSAATAGSYRDAIKLALSSLEHIDGMMQYERRYENAEFTSIETIDLVLEYAPFLFDYPSLDALESLLKDRRRIEKNTSASLAEKLAEARSRMWSAHRLWDYLELHPDTREDALHKHLGGDRERLRSVVTVWDKMGLVHRTPEGRSYCLSLCTRMGRVVRAKCPLCGAVSEAPKAMFLEKMTCHQCERSVSFVILTRNPGRESGG